MKSKEKIKEAIETIQEAIRSKYPDGGAALEIHEGAVGLYDDDGTVILDPDNGADADDAANKLS